ncbi:hypothetical protein JKG47_23445 [Acidithiobacillus sp. MC6.1]|nr:hypothetical protein [Acidithiobacillus sp. MC6.1]
MRKEVPNKSRGFELGSICGEFRQQVRKPLIPLTRQSNGVNTYLNAMNAQW